MRCSNNKNTFDFQYIQTLVFDASVHTYIHTHVWEYFQIVYSKRWMTTIKCYCFSFDVFIVIRIVRNIFFIFDIKQKKHLNDIDMLMKTYVYLHNKRNGIIKMILYWNK